MGPTDLSHGPVQTLVADPAGALTYDALSRRAVQVLGGPEIPDAKAPHLEVLLALLQHSRDGAEMAPSLYTLQLETLLARSTIKRALRDLVGWQALIVTGGGADTRTPTRYAVGPVLQIPYDRKLRRALLRKHETQESLRQGRQDRFNKIEKERRRMARAIKATSYLPEKTKRADEGDRVEYQITVQDRGIATRILEEDKVDLTDFDTAAMQQAITEAQVKKVTRSLTLAESFSYGCPTCKDAGCKDCGYE